MKPAQNAGQSPRFAPHLLLLAVVCVWGSTFVLIKDALRDITPLLFNLLRMVLAALCLALIYRRHLRRISRATLLAGALVGLCLGLGYQFQTAGLRLTTPSKSAFLTGLVVIFVPLLSAWPRLRPPQAPAPRWNAWAGAAVAFAGIVLLTTPSHSALDLRSINRGDLLTLVCSLGFALHVLALARFSPKIPFQQLAVLQVGFCALFMAVSLPLFEHPALHWTPRVLAALLVAALLATAAAFTIQSWAQQFLPATHTALILALEPVFAWLTALLFLDEGLSRRAASGALLILAGIALTEFIPLRIQPSAHEGVPLP